MMKKAIVVLLCSLIAANVIAQSNRFLIAFGSCNDQDRTQEMWNEIIAQHPDVWIWVGDNIYSDFKNPAGRPALYQKQKSNADYQRLIATCQVTGTWDDHDYGVNDGGKNYGLKKQSQQLAMDFLGFDKNNPVRHHEGIYNSVEYGRGKQKIKIINLDTRTFRDTVLRENYVDTLSGKKMYRMLPNLSGDILGEHQWAWLKQELKNTSAKVVIVNSSIQVLPRQHRFEKWANLPKAKERLLSLLSESGKNIILISGDRHVAEFSKTQMANGKALYEFTSSGLTHTWAEPWKEDNEFRIGELVIEKNFGIIQIDWKGSEPTIEMRVMGLRQQVFNKVSFSF